MPEVKARRSYSSPLRRSQAEATRRAVLDAARTLFISQGYGATTLDQIAKRAGVSKPTVFNTVGNKQALLRVVRDATIAGDYEPVPVAQRTSTDAIRQEPDRRRAIDLLAHHLTGVARRYGVIYEQVRVAAAGGEEELRGMWETEERERLVGAGFWVDVLRRKGESSRLRTDLRTAVDTMWILMAPDNFNRLVHARGWTARKYERFLAAQITELFTRPGR